MPSRSRSARPPPLRALSASWAGALWLGVGAPPALAQAQEPSEVPAPAGAGVGAPVVPPKRLRDVLDAPAWLRFGLEQRTRVEHLEDDYHAGSKASSSALSSQTLLSAELRFAPLHVVAELQDARAFATEGTLVDNTLVDAADVLQLYVALRRDGLFARGDSASLALGRFTMDVGSRRLVARSEFRNTMTSFTGVDLQWTSPARHVVRGFATLPVRRLPTDDGALSRNAVELDLENPDALFCGVFFGSAPLAADLRVESYVLGLFERDRADTPTSDRRLVTPGARVFRPPARGRLDFQLEGMLQVGASRATKEPTDTTDLEHRAASLHAMVGYRFEAPWSPRLALQYDYAGGDEDPADRNNGRFDPLFGERRFELGPAGLYGAFARSNISSPGLRVELAPWRNVDAFAAYRPYWLASARDAWTTAGMRDKSGASGTFLGHQLEARVRWQVLPKNLSLEVGGIALTRGTFSSRAPGAHDAAPLYVYAQVISTL